MNIEYWDQLESILKGYQFLRDLNQRHDPSMVWFGRTEPNAAVTTYLRFEFKPTFRVLTTHMGWRHEESHGFCLEVLESDWPRGFSWLTEVGVTSSPCLTLFNLGDYMGWPLGGIPIGDPRSAYQSTVLHLCNVISSGDWVNADARTLLARYVEDQKPFSWRSSNSAIRLAEIAGLCLSLGDKCEVFERCGVTHSLLIEVDMFNLGSASDWISSLRTRLRR